MADLLRQLITRLRARLAPRPAAPAPTPAPAAPTPAAPAWLGDLQQPVEVASGTRWHAMPGDVLELADTGWQVRLNRGRFTPQLPGRYVLFSPEGELMGWGPTLLPVKTTAEHLAAERAQFDWKKARP